MSNRGYLYALINPSMPGLVKVGKTERDPTDRAAQLSGATGVATPFIVAYHQFFGDCHQAERFVHAYLEAKGVRVAPNREFFSASLPDVVKAISIAPGASEPTLLHGNMVRQNQTKPSRPATSSREPWEDVLREALVNLNGTKDELEDFPRAMQLFQQAAKLGCAEAYRYLGEFYEFGWGVREDMYKALEYFREGVRRGNGICYGEMANVYRQIRDTESESKCWRLFFKAISEGALPPAANTSCVINLMVTYVFFCLLYGRRVEYRTVLSYYREPIYRKLQESSQREPDVYAASMKWVATNL